MNAVAADHVLPITSYDVEDLYGCLQRVREILPKATAIRTDILKAGPVAKNNQARVIIEGIHAGPMRFTLCGVTTHVPIAKICGLQEEPARYLARLFKHIASLNPLGAWCLAPQSPARAALSRHAVADQRLAPDSYLSDVVTFLADELANVNAIHIQYLITQKGGQQRRRAFLRFLGPEGGTEVAALDAAGFALHARHQLLRPQGENQLEVNLSRMAYWAASLGTTPDRLAECIADFNFLASVLHITHVDLGRRAKSGPNSAIARENR